MKKLILLSVFFVTISPNTIPLESLIENLTEKSIKNLEAIEHSKNYWKNRKSILLNIISNRSRKEEIKKLKEEKIKNLKLLAELKTDNLTKDKLNIILKKYLPEIKINGTPPSGFKASYLRYAPALFLMVCAGYNYDKFINIFNNNLFQPLINLKRIINMPSSPLPPPSRFSNQGNEIIIKSLKDLEELTKLPQVKQMTSMLRNVSTQGIPRPITDADIQGANLTLYNMLLDYSLSKRGGIDKNPPNSEIYKICANKAKNHNMEEIEKDWNLAVQSPKWSVLNGSLMTLIAIQAQFYITKILPLLSGATQGIGLINNTIDQANRAIQDVNKNIISLLNKLIPLSSQGIQVTEELLPKINMLNHLALKFSLIQNEMKTLLKSSAILGIGGIIGLQIIKKQFSYKSIYKKNKIILKKIEKILIKLKNLEGKQNLILNGKLIFKEYQLKKCIKQLPSKIRKPLEKDILMLTSSQLNNEQKIASIAMIYRNYKLFNIL